MKNFSKNHEKFHEISALPYKKSSSDYTLKFQSRSAASKETTVFMPINSWGINLSPLNIHLSPNAECQNYFGLTAIVENVRGDRNNLSSFPPFFPHFIPKQNTVNRKHYIYVPLIRKPRVTNQEFLREFSKPSASFSQQGESEKVHNAPFHFNNFT